jgi:uncharacterized protein YndB with AHSA1/START domain
VKIKSKKILDVSVNEVWEILRDPENMPAWNPKCQDCYEVPAEVSAGTRFRATFELSGKRNKVFCEVMDYKPCERIRIRYSGPAFKSDSNFVDETFLLNSQGPHHTLIRHEVDFSNSGIPILFRFLMWFISTFGYQVGPSSLDGIKDLMEYNSR